MFPVNRCDRQTIFHYKKVINGNRVELYADSTEYQVNLQKSPQIYKSTILWTHM